MAFSLKKLKFYSSHIKKNGVRSLGPLGSFRIGSFLVKTQNTILSAALVLSIASGINAILGMLKGRLLAQYFGVSNDLAIFYTADRIPNLIYSILVVGAVSTVFIPVFTDLLKRNRETAFETASSIINAVFGFFVLVGSITFILSPWIIKLLSVGQFSGLEIVLGANLMRIMLISQVILVAGSLATSILHSFKYFMIPAMAPVFYNLGMLFGIIFLSGKYGIYGPTYGTILGALLHLGIQLPLLAKTGYIPSLSFNFGDKGLRELLHLIPPRLLSVFLANLVGTINNSLAILISAASVVYLKFALQLQTFPVLLFGLSMASASLPTLSEQGDRENMERFKKTFLTSFHQMMFLVIPLSVILLVLRVPVVRIVYGVSNFPWEATVQTSYVLAFFSLSIFSQSAYYLITRAFFALKDTYTPVKVSLFTIVLNLGLSLFFVVYLKLEIWAVALAFSFTSILDMILLMWLLNKKVGGFGVEKLLGPFLKISYAALLMGITLYLPLKLLDIVVIDTSRTLNLLLLTGIASFSGGATYLILTKLFKVEEIELFYKLMRKLDIRRNLRRKRVLLEHTEDTVS